MQHLRDLRQYVTDLNSIPRLWREEVRQLTSAIAAARQESPSSDLAAQVKQRLIEGHLWLAVALVKRSGVRLCTLSPLDPVQEGNLGLLRAFDRFDFAAGGNFTAYASTTIHYAILDALPMEDTIRLTHDLSWRNRTDERVEAIRALQPLSLDALHGDQDCAFVDLLAASPLVLPDPAEEKRHQAKRAKVEALLARLTPHEQQLLRLRYGLDEADGRAHTLTAIAQHLGLDPSTVCTFERGALQKLRAPQHPEGEEAHHPGTHRRPASPRSPQEQAQRRQEKFQRLEAACAELVAQGVPINVRTLARFAHIDKTVIQPFVRLYWGQQGSEQERLEAACAALEAEGIPVTMARLCSRAHVGSRAAAAFLKNYHPVVRPKPPSAASAKPVRPAKASPQERLNKAYTHLVAQGEQITRARLRQEAGASTDAARGFLRALRTGKVNPDLPSIERGNR
jgi:RNA polymerase sigma factor (sigma-70 family)